MRLISFRIKNFRSIVDTGWVNCSADNVTALVGQNESGKTAVLEALAKTFTGDSVQIDDLRHDDPLPQIWLCTEWTDEELSTSAHAIKKESCRQPIVDAIAANGKRTTWFFSTAFESGNDKILATSYELEAPALLPIVSKQLQASANIELIANTLANIALVKPEGGVPHTPEALKPTVEQDAIEIVDDFTDSLFGEAPLFVLFEETSGLLPNQIEIADNFSLEKNEGQTAAQNFLTIAGINLNALIKSDTRARAATLKKANKQITDDFLAFWSQTIGGKSTLQLECSVHQHAAGHEKAGRSYLEFLITDSAAALYPRQRSRGTSWFMSFFLQLRASKVNGGNIVFLLDEPGSNLHEKAQGDVLTLIEVIREKIGVIYSTHSPHLISEKSLNRILAVERDITPPTYGTKIIDAHALGAASTDTLSPIFTAMGVSLSRQTSIRKHNNVILEELSSYYYLQAFWKLTDCPQEVYFLPATGTSNVPVFAQLFLGWGLDFIVLVDDEPSGRTVYKNLKRDLFLDDDEWAGKRLLKIKDCEGIEDIFDPTDYKTFVLNNPLLPITQTNSKWAKVNGAAKAIHALKFLQKVERKELTLVELQASTQQRITALVAAIQTRLENY